jgi:prevent-host-death family protein
MPEMSTEELRRNLSQVINRAAYGIDPVLITRRGRKIAALISLDDFALLVRMQQQRDRMRADE